MRVSIGISILGTDYHAYVDVRITARSDPGGYPINGIYGPDAPTGCEWELEDVELHEDTTAGLGPILEAPAWLVEAIRDSDKLADAVSEGERDLPRGRRHRED
jgi:hypothetical protein